MDDKPKECPDKECQATMKRNEEISERVNNEMYKEDGIRDTVRLHTERFNNLGKEFITRRSVWVFTVGNLVMIIATVVSVFLYFSDIKAATKDLPKLKEQVQTNKDANIEYKHLLKNLNDNQKKMIDQILQLGKDVNNLSGRDKEIDESLKAIIKLILNQRSGTTTRENTDPSRNLYIPQ